MSTPSPWEQPARRVVELLRRGEREAALAAIEEAGAAHRAGGPLPGFREVAGAVYWKVKALPEFVQLSEEIVRQLEGALATADSADARSVLRKPLGGTLYNLAAFTWDGWDEPGIEAGPAERKAGRAAARRCLELRLAPENAVAGFGFTPAMARWVVGAHALSERSFREAREQFALAAEEERSGGEDDTLSRGYSALADLVEQPADAAAQAGFRAILMELDAREEDRNAAFYREQLLTARRVYLGD